MSICGLDALTVFTIVYWVLYAILLGPMIIFVTIYLPEIPVRFVKTLLKANNEMRNY